MDVLILDFIKLVVTAGLSITGTLLATQKSFRNSLEMSRLQLESREKELEKERQSKENDLLQAWFIDFACTNCVDLLLTDVTNLKEVLIRATISNHLGVSYDLSSPTLPTTAQINLFSLLGSTKLVVFCNMIRGAENFFARDKNKAEEFTDALNKLTLVLVRLKQALLETKISSRGEACAFFETHAGLVSKFSQAIDEIVDEFLPELKAKEGASRP